MPWHATLQLDYRLESLRTTARFKHNGPLRILQSLYPEGDAVCHNVLVHPPGGLVGGDTLDMRISAAAGSHGLITTPGATRFYKSTGEQAVQRSVLKLEEGARMEWLPLESIAYNDCRAHNELRFELAPGAELLGWDVTALGLPNAQLPFEQGAFQQHIEFPGVWLERGGIAAADKRLLDGPLGFAGHRCLASLFFAAGSRLERERRQQALDVAREMIEAHALRDTAGATSPDAQIVVVRVLAPVVEPAMDLLRQIWQRWRVHFWRMPAAPPRIWST
jgi:urease accessory protein